MIITPWAYINAQPKPEDQPAFDYISAAGKDIFGLESGNPSQTVGYLAEGSTIDYFYAKWGTLALSIEGRRGGEERHFAEHVKFWDQMFAWCPSTFLHSPHQFTSAK